MIVSREQPGDYRFLTMRSRDILHQAKGGSSWSSPLRWFSRWSGRGGWSGRAVAQQRTRDSKLGLKGLSNYRSNETAVKAARQGASGPNKRATLTKCLLEKGELENSSKLDWKRAKGSPQNKKASHIKRKNCLLQLRVTLQMGEDEDGDDDDTVSENQLAIHKAMWQHFGVLRIKCQKVGLNSRTLPILRWGAQFSPNT